MGRVISTCRASAPISSSIDGKRRGEGTEAAAEARSEREQSREHANKRDCENDGGAGGVRGKLPFSLVGARKFYRRSSAKEAHETTGPQGGGGETKGENSMRAAAAGMRETRQPHVADSWVRRW
jgi:hypothetical protein